MKKEELILKIKQNSKSVQDQISSLSEEQLNNGLNEKWSPIKHLDHLLRSVQPLNKALKIPLPGLRILFGQPNREGRSYDELVAKYHLKLSQGGKASGRYIPSARQESTKIVSQFKEQNKQLCKTIGKWKEEDLDRFLLPHPLLGKLTIREMIYFTIYHMEHHLQLMRVSL
jgi:hypothetical protein